MRVLAAIVVPPHLSVSGAATAGEHLSAALAAHCHMAVVNMGPEPEVRGGRAVHLPVRVHDPLQWTKSLLPSRYRTPFYWSNIPAIVRDGRFDLVHLHNPTPAIEMARIARACRSGGIPYVVSTHGFVEVAGAVDLHHFGPAGRIAYSLLASRPLRYVLEHAAHVLALSPADAPLVRQLGYGSGPIDIVPNGVFPPARPGRAADRETTTYRRFGLPLEDDAAIKCFFLANHSPNKGLEVLLRAFATVESPYVLVVGGEKRDLVDYDAYERAAGPRGRVVFTGHLSDAEVDDLFAYADLFVFPTLADTFPLVVLEAMAHGVPVVASRVGGIPYQVDASSGRLVDPGDVAGLAAVIDDLARQPGLRAELAVGARQRALREFSWQRSAESAFQVYREVDARHRAEGVRRSGGGERRPGAAAALQRDD
jgi:glycosyltransferase involved in cell wall biosynthesis